MPAEPPEWCITGPSLEGESDPALWNPKYPYEGDFWKQWLLDKRAGRQRPIDEYSFPLWRNRLPWEIEKTSPKPYTVDDFGLAADLLMETAKETEELEIEKDGKPGIATGSRLAEYAWLAILAQRFDDALAASDRAQVLAPHEILAAYVQGHALMFLGRAEGARKSIKGSPTMPTTMPPCSAVNLVDWRRTTLPRK